MPDKLPPIGAEVTQGELPPVGGVVYTHTPARAEDFMEPAPEGGSAVSRFMGGAWDALNPATAVRGLARAVMHPIETGQNIVRAQGEQFTKASDDYQQGRYSEMLGHAAAGVLPIIGPAAAAAGEQIGTGDVAGGAGAATGLLLGTAGGGPAVRAVGKVTRPLTARAGEALYQSALKPTKAALKHVRTAPGAGPDAARRSLVQTGLREGIPVSARGVKKVESLVDDLNAQVEAKLASAEAQGLTVDPSFVEAQIKAVAADFTDQINAQPDLAAIETVRGNFASNPKVAQPQFPVEAEASALSRHVRAGRDPKSFRSPEAAVAPGPIPVQTAQRMKQNTYKGLRGKYGVERGATIEAEKAGARGLKEGIETAAPDVAGLNAREGALIPLEEAISDAMRRRGNYGIFGLTPVVASLPAITSGNFWPLLAAMTDRMPGLMSRAGIAINRAGQTGAATQRAARATTAGVAVEHGATAAMVPAMAEEDREDPRRARAQR